jgi:hypothetical protein
MATNFEDQPMRQRGRKSADRLAINVNGDPPRLNPPSGLNPKECKLFEQLIAAADPRHFRESDSPLLVSLVQATLMAHKLGRDPSKVAEWEKATRVQAMLATKLRMTPQARTDPKVIARMQQNGIVPWHRKEQEDEHEHEIQ